MKKKHKKSETVYNVELTDNKDGTYTLVNVTRFRPDRGTWVPTGPGNIVKLISNGNLR